MKLRIQTLTGETQEVEAEPRNTILDLKKIIYKQMKISGAVRVIKGQEVLPDDSILEKHGITDGFTINIVIEPEKELNLTFKLGPKEFPYSVKSSVLVRELKQQLRDDATVGFENIYLIPSGIATDVPLEDESLPLHLYGVGDNTTIRIIGGKVHIQLVTQFGRLYWKSFPRNINVNQMKQRLVDRFFSDNDKDLEDIWLFIKHGESYRRLDEDNDEQPIGSVLSDNDVIHLVEERFFPDSDVFPVYYKGEEVGRVGWKMIGISGSGYASTQSDTAISLKLRIQELQGFPVSSIDVKFRGKSMKNDERINHQYVKKATEIRIEVV